MARAFLNGSSQYLISSGTPITAAPFTISCWYQYSTDTSGVLVGIGDKDTTSNEYILYANTGGADSLSTYRAGAGGPDATIGGAITKNVWHHAALVVVAEDDIIVYSDGSGTADNASVAIANWDHVTIGCEATSARGTYLTGYVAEAALWTAALTQAEINILSAAYSPLFVRPQSLAAYWPLIRDEDQDRVGGYNMTAYNSPTVVAHPRVVYPALPIFMPTVAVGGPSPSVSPSVSPSESPSISPSASESPSVSPSPSPSPAVMEVVWGHDTDVLESNVRDFENNWTGTGAIENAGVADTERLALEAGEYMISEVVNTGAVDVVVLYNVYASGDTVDLDYRHGATVAACESAEWQDYSGAFESLGYIQVRVTSTL